VNSLDREATESSDAMQILVGHVDKEPFKVIKATVCFNLKKFQKFEINYIENNQS